MKLPRNVYQLLIMLETAALIVVVIFGAVHMQRSAGQKNKSESPVSAEKSQNKISRDDLKKKPGKAVDPAETEETAGTEVFEELEPAVFSEEVNAKLASMTLEEKVAQMFLISPEALTHSDAVEIAGESTKGAVNNYPVGGLVYASVNFKDKEQTKSMLSGVQQYCNERIGLPMFLAVEESGGSDYSPLAAANGYEVQPLPAEIGAGGQPEAAAKAADGIASYLSEEGFNLNLIPSAELAGGTDSAHDNRCYGADASGASSMLAETISASHAKGISTAIGSFPGKRAEGFNGEEWTTWEDEDALLFQAGINGETELVMLGNTTCEKLTGDAQTLCSLSKGAVCYLRNHMGYTGIIMTASLSEEIVTGKYSSGEAAVEAVKNGVNVIYRPANFEEAYQAVIDAVNNSEIGADVIDQAAGYILTKKLAMAGGV